MEARIKKNIIRELRIRTSEGKSFLTLTVYARLEKTGLFHDFIAKFLDYRIRQDFLGHALNLLFGGLARHAVQIEHKKLALADIPNLAKA